MAAATSDSDDAISAINVTPFVDIVLVLLIILMVTSSAIVKSQLQVELPKAASGGESVESTVNVMITKDGKLHLDGATVSESQLATRVKRASRGSPKLQAVIAADKGVPYGRIVAVIDVVKSNGVKSFALNVERPRGRE